MQMHWTIEFERDRQLAVIRTSGRFNLRDYVAMTREILARDFWRPGMDTLFDHRALDFHDTGFETMSAVTRTHEGQDEQIGPGRCAIVMKDEADFGRGRMWENISQDRISVRSRIFTDLATARAWLESGAGG